ncbi:proprotein convertase P-domain-containing protein [Streptomyces sp. NPDC002587]
MWIAASPPNDRRPADGLVGAASNKLQVYVDVTHEWLGNVKIDLVAPDGAST